MFDKLAQLKRWALERPVSPWGRALERRLTDSVIGSRPDAGYHEAYAMVADHTDAHRAGLEPWEADA